ncbi:DUF1904 family protein [Paenibacillus solisilvae]|uniref:DUF1904 family protein n=1 Tax=Paenibacillus solisilvae TaxID=2486751 RepID=A0ABW0VX34_9BACL
MPQLVVKGISPQVMMGISKLLVEELVEICQCAADNFTIDCLSVTSVFGGETVTTYPFVEVAWFERGPVIRDAFARAVTQHLHAAGVVDVELAFKVYEESAYYINGESCSA